MSVCVCVVYCGIFTSVYLPVCACACTCAFVERAEEAVRSPPYSFCSFEPGSPIGPETFFFFTVGWQLASPIVIGVDLSLRFSEEMPRFLCPRTRDARSDMETEAVMKEEAPLRGGRAPKQEEPLLQESWPTSAGLQLTLADPCYISLF